MFIQSLCKGKTFIERNERREEIIEEEIEGDVSRKIIEELFNTNDLGYFDKVIQEKLFHEKIPFPFVEKLFNHIKEGKIDIEEFDENFGYTRQFVAFMVFLELM